MLAQKQIWRCGLAGCLTIFGALGCSENSHVVACAVSYGGETKLLEFAPTQNPYAVKAIDIAGRFAFKAVYVRKPWLAASIHVYAYRATSSGPRLLQEGKYAPPFATTGDPRYGFTGRQLVYSNDQRELEYWCGLSP